MFPGGFQGRVPQKYYFPVQFQGQGFQIWEPPVIYIYGWLSQRSTQHWSLTHQIGYPPNTGVGSERTKCRKVWRFWKAPWIQHFFIFWIQQFFIFWIQQFVIFWKNWRFVNVENVGAKRTSMLPHGPTNSHLTKENQHLN